MVAATFRFYEELNDFLPFERRKRPFACLCPLAATVKNAIENLGVPHTEVELILVNGESVDFAHRVADGDSISVYPKFEAFDITPLLKVRARPLRELRFIADAHLGGLARRLRMLGFDTLYRNTYDDREIAELAEADHRIVLTRDRDLLMHRSITHGCFVRGKQTLEQLSYVMARLDLKRAVRPFTLCLECNRALEPASKPAISSKLPARAAIHYDDFRSCPTCGRVYWKGSHWERMRCFVESLEKTGLV